MVLAIFIDLIDSTNFLSIYLVPSMIGVGDAAEDKTGMSCSSRKSQSSGEGTDHKGGENKSAGSRETVDLQSCC